MMMKFIAKMEGTVDGFASTVGEVKTTTAQNIASIQMLQRQVGQIAEVLQTRIPGQFPSQTERKPREDVKSIYLRNGKVINPDLTQDVVVNESEKEPEVEVVEVEEEEPVTKGASSIKEPKRKEPEIVVKPASKPTMTQSVPNVPYPTWLKAQKYDLQFSKFLEMPSYAKFLKDIISNKRKIEDQATVALTEECSAIILNKLPQKLKDPGSFAIPVHIGNSDFSRALCDLGTNINLMPLTLFRKLGLGEVQSTNITLQLTDRTIKYPYGVIEDVLVKVDKFYLPLDFMVLDMEEDRHIPLILGRPFLATGRALIDVERGKLTLRVGDETAEFSVFKAARNQGEHDMRYRADILDSMHQDDCIHAREMDELEDALTGLNSDLDSEVVMQLNLLPVYKGPKRPIIEDLGAPLPKSQPSSKVPPKLDLKPLLCHLKYAFLGANETLPVIISAYLLVEEKEKLLRVLRAHQSAIGWTIANLKGISPTFCTHRINMDEGHRPVVQPQRRLNPIMKEVVRKEALKVLDVGITYSTVSQQTDVSSSHGVIA
ncbi:hypothetical protein OSB04_019400 [Centaurea solstitialis]|uniref:Uncharacterized protein n=1 Tax=Centaurea solstitialis TaxID=347529 RepID=A0AA38W504_9ASTR|nr:hypothetical protein OSB04_019400 [Centaurea solstitialis]